MSTSTKLGCGEGGCGACTVMLSKYNPTNKKIRHYSANACLTPVCSLHGMAVTTVEGIGSIKNGLHPVQERIAKSHGSQCGFCTPGIVMSMYTLLRNNPLPSTTDMESNLCRCTGYRPILEGFKTFTKEYCQMGENCCKNKTQNNAECDGKNEEQSRVATELFNSRDFLPLDPTQDPIFPPELQTNKFDTECLTFSGERVQWFRPIRLEMKLKNQHYPVIIAPTHIKELNEINQLENGYKFGASVTLTEIEHTLKEAIQQLPDYKTRVYQAVVEMLRWFAGHQIRNVAAVGGNIMTASPISDLNPVFLACGAVLEVASKGGGTRNVKMDENFFVSYRKTVIKPTEVKIIIPYTQQIEYFWAYKQAHRRDDDIAIVNGGMKVVFENNSNVIKDMALAFGGMAPTTVMAVKTMKQVIGRKWEDNLVTDVCNLLKDDLPLDPSAPGGMVEFRRTLTTSFFFKFYLTVQIQLQQKSVHLRFLPHTKVLHLFTSPSPSKSTQLYEEVPSGQPDNDPVGRPMTHLSAMKQATGEAVYIDDMPRFSNELYLAFVLSTKAYAELVKVDATQALTMPGVVDFITHKDLKHNMWGAVFPDDEEIIASEKVVSVGQIIGAILADNQDHAQRAAKAVKVEEAIAEGSFYLPTPSINFGDVEKGFEDSDHVIEGEVHIGGQEHFYLETQATLGVPKNEDGELEMFISTQNPTENQLVIAEALGMDANKIVIRVKRMGGGFGGKETRSNPLSVCVAAAAQKHGRPVRCMLDRNEDMVHTGTRHPFLGKYKVGFKEDGKIQAVMDRAMFHSDNAYKIPNLSVTGYCCKTNTPSNTAFRGFGGPQGMFVAEVWMDDVAKVLGMSPVEVRQKNLYKEDDCTHYNQVLENCTVERCWTECLKQSNYDRRRKDVNIFNSFHTYISSYFSENRWKKRGISVIPVKFGISYTALFLNQAGALVHIYRDGSVLLTHGGTEMGQGLHTKMIQVASRTLHIPTSKIHISETSTSTVPNTSPTAASASSDLNGMAVQSFQLI
ncbi:hypothetical protein KUTeg_014194 [Tegillarca granosa]|uniref:Xanthine dehydrogenase n=1 Tax=Tegillarca granosa TaxID=220873 RepID=A0ABQ9EVV0_TEGGR|nr:hypothetical protein KUTeg_014194 [Tegillarca granosa]